MKSQNNAVGDAVFWSAYWNVHVAVHGAVYWEVWHVWQALREAGWREVTGAVDGAVRQPLSDSEHPALQDFLREAR